MEYKARMDSNSLYLRHHNQLVLHLLLLVLLLASFPSTIAQDGYRPGKWEFDDIFGDPSAHSTEIAQKTPPPAHSTEKKQKKDVRSYVDQQSSAENYMQCAAECQCPVVCEPPLTLESKAFEQLKDNLAPVICEHLTDLVKKTLTVLESATEAAHKIYLLKLLNESNYELNKFRD